MRPLRLNPLLSLAAVVLLLPATQAWLPGNGPEHRLLLDRSGANLFNETAFVNTAFGGDTSGQPQKKRWITEGAKARGVNLGSLFIVEPWMMGKSWGEMGCGGMGSEFDCMKKLGQEAGDAAFKKHWEEWIPEADFDLMRASGINTIRVPLGYWMLEELVDRNNEYFPKGAVPYLKQVCKWASDRGIYVILELHGGPGAQVAHNSFTGQIRDPAGFYETAQYDRAIKFVAWIRQLIAESPELSSVGTIGLMNEPEHHSDGPHESLRSYYYPKAIEAIRAVEKRYNVTKNATVHVQMMNRFWGSGDPLQFLQEQHKEYLNFDDHRYLKWAGVQDVSHEGFIRESCKDDRSADGVSPTIVGEWSIAVPDDVEQTEGWKPTKDGPNGDFYRKWFAAQALSYEKTVWGWTFWSWKTELGEDFRWSFKDALAAGIIPKDLKDLTSPC